MDTCMTIPVVRGLVTILLCAGLLGAAGAVEKTRDDSDAHRIMARAVEARAVWDESFPGFTADLEVNYEGEIRRGQVRVTPQAEVKLIALSEPRSDAWEWARGWLGMLVFHRTDPGAENEYRDIRMVGDRNHPLGVMLALDDEFDSSFRVDGKIIRQVNRDLAAGESGDGTKLKRVRINVLEARETPEGKVLPLHFVINYFDDERRLAMIDALSSRFVRLGGYDLPRWCRVITTRGGEMVTGVLRLSGYQLGGRPATAASSAFDDRRGLQLSRVRN